MRKRNLLILAAAVIAGLFICGCVERQLTINTVPQNAVITLNDEEIGQSPVTVSFNWYGDYRVRIAKEGYETLNTHKELKAPLHDKFPFDFFAQVLSPKKIVDKYEWTFQLEPAQEPDRDKLILDAQKLKGQI